MKPDDILKEVLSDPELVALLKISDTDIEQAGMDKPSDNPLVEIIKAVIRGGYNGSSTQQMFNEIKRIKGL